jgi:hypothetical protein
MTQVTNFAFSAHPNEFMAVQNKADEIAKEYGMSRSIVWRTLLIDAMGVKPINPELHERYLKNINEALGRK